MESIQIGIVHMGFFYSGGGERTVLRQAKYLEKLGHQVEIFAPIISKECFPELFNEVKSQEMCDWIPNITPLRPAVSMIMNSLLIPFDKLRQNEVLLAHGQPSNWIAYRVHKKTGIPYFGYLHQVNRFQKPRQVDISGKWGPDDNIRFLKAINQNNPIIKRLDIETVKNSRKVITNSNWIKRQVEEYYRIDPELCYPGIDRQGKPHFDERNEIVLTTNRHYPQKRIDYLLQVMGKVLGKIPTSKCVITGRLTKHSEDLIKLRNEMRLEKKITFTGIITERELKHSYANSSVYCFTSPEEDLGLGPLEAASHGTPSVVWDHAGPRETVVEGVTGVRVRRYDINRMSEEVSELLVNQKKRKEMGERAWKHVNTHFSWEKHCEKLSNIISSS